MSEYILPELISNILARLPVDDVLRCTSVCKSWYSLITSPSFQSLHLNLSSPNQEPRLLIRGFRSDSRYSDRFENQRIRISYGVYRDNQTFDEIAKLDCPILCNPATIDSLHGLVCLCGGERLVLWNPSLRKSLILPKSRVLSYHSRATGIHTVGFGFVATSNEYKIVRFSYAVDITTVPQPEIYELKTGSWRDLKHENSLNVEVRSEQAHLNGILHWYAFNPRKVNPTSLNFIFSFDLKTEKFGTWMLPSCLRLGHDDNDDDVYMPSTFRESLCLIDQTFLFYGDWRCKIWVMKEYGVADSWEKLFDINTIQHDLQELLYFRDNGEFLFQKRQSSGDRELVSLDYKNNRVKNDGLPTSGRFTSVHSYVENLVLIKGPNEVNIDEESSNIP